MSQANHIDSPYLLVEPPKTLPLELPAIPMRDASVVEMLSCVAHAYQASAATLLGPKKHKAAAEARLVAYWVLRTLTRLSFPEIGLALNRDHTSVMAGFRRVVARRERDAGFAAFTDGLSRAVAARLEVKP